MTKKELKQLKEDVLSLLTDKNIGKLIDNRMIEGEKEQFGALVTISVAFRETNKVFAKYNI